MKYKLIIAIYVCTHYDAYVGIDPSKHRIKLENERLKRAMVRAKQIEDKSTLMPRINKDAAKRFMRNSLWELKRKEDNGKSTEKKLDKSEESLPV